MYVGLSSSPYYTLWCKSYKTNNNLHFNRHHSQRECLQSMLKQLRKVPLPPPPVRRCPHLTKPPPLCGRPHLASYTALWSDSVIAGAVKIRCSLISSGHFTPTPCGLICGSCN